jgi:hypothetical protein
MTHKWGWGTKTQTFFFPSSREFPVSTSFFSLIFLYCQVTLVTITKIIEEESFLKKLLDQLEKRVFWHIHKSWPNSLNYSSQIKSQIAKKKFILESPCLILLVEIKIFIFDSHKASFGHLKVWSKIDKFDHCGIVTQKSRH